MSYLLLTIAANVVMIFVMRYSEQRQGNRYAVTVFNYITGVVVSLCLLGGHWPQPGTQSLGLAVGLSFTNTLCMVGCMLLIQYSILKNGAPMTTTFNRLGILIPTVLSIFLFREAPSLLQAAGLAAATFAIVYLSGGRSGPRIAAPLGLMAVFVVGGLIDFHSKVYNIFGQPSLQEFYVLSTFILSFFISLGLLLWKNRRISLQDVLCGILVGLPNQAVTFCMVKAAAVLPAYVVFPVYSAAVILVVNLINFLVFREKPTPRELRGTGIIAAALVLLNL